MQSNVIKRIGKSVLISGALLGFLAGPGVRSLRADCQSDTARIDHKLHDAIKTKGPDSKEADHWRHELNAERQRCWDANHKWWDEDEHRWHTDKDWDEHDHH
jgi:hypothetical protein